MELIEELKKIRKLVVIALFSDDYFMNIFVLKGGNALDLAYKLSSRTSVDIDISMESDFSDDEKEEIKAKLEHLLIQTFYEENYNVFDFKFLPRPMKPNPDTGGFWGGYCIEFKIIKRDNYERHHKNIDSLRRNAMVIGEKQLKVFTIDISKYEFCKGKQEENIDNFTIYVYSPLMFVYEKLRAICQQMEKYREIIPTNRRPRAKDFFDIYIVINSLDILNDFINPINLDMLNEIFNVKKVPLSFLGEIEGEREFHRESFNSVRDSIYSHQEIESYDFYFDYVIKLVRQLESWWKV